MKPHHFPLQVASIMKGPTHVSSQAAATAATRSSTRAIRKLNHTLGRPANPRSPTSAKPWPSSRTRSSLVKVTTRLPGRPPGQLASARAGRLWPQGPKERMAQLGPVSQIALPIRPRRERVATFSVITDRSGPNHFTHRVTSPVMVRSTTLEGERPDGPFQTDSSCRGVALAFPRG
jgi:hypothetical protein